MTDSDQGVRLAEACQRAWELERELTIVRARVRTLTAEVIAGARREEGTGRRTLRVAPYADGRPVEEHADDAHVLINSPTVWWGRHAREQGE